MRECKCRLIFKQKWQYLNRSKARFNNFQQTVFPPMFPNNSTGEVVKLKKLTDLIRISGRQDDQVSTIPQFLHNRKKERDVRGIVQIDPDLFAASVVCPCVFVT